MADWSEILEAVTTSLSGDRQRGPTLLLERWAETAGDDHAHRCVLAHYLADLEPDLDDEIRWDETALAEHAYLMEEPGGEGSLAAVGIPAAGAMAPSLHLTHADGDLRRGDIEAAREQVALGQASVGLVGDDGYGTLVRSGLDRLAATLDPDSPGPA